MSLVGRVCSQKFGTHAYMQQLTQQEKQKCKSTFGAAQQAGCKILKSAEPPADLLSANAFKRSQSFSCKETFLSSSAGLKSMQRNIHLAIAAIVQDSRHQALVRHLTTSCTLLVLASLLSHIAPQLSFQLR